MKRTTYTLQAITDFITDGKHGDCQSQDNSGFYFISSKDINDGNVNYHDARQITENDFLETNKRTRFEPGDILLTNSGTIGRMAIAKNIDETRRTTFQKSVAIIKPNKKRTLPLWLYYYLKGNINILIDIASGAAQKNLLLKDIRAFKVNLPEYELQQKTASVLSTYDDLIDINRRRIQLLEEAARLLFREWFVYFRFPGHEKVRIIKDGISKTPEGWTKEKVVNVVKRIPPGELYDQEIAESTGSVPILDQGQSGIIGYHNNEPSVIASLDNPVIVFANHTCNQRIINFPFSAIQNVLPFLPSKENYRNIYWLHYATDNLVQFNGYKGHWPEFMAKTILLPPKDLCDKFGDIISLIYKQLFNLSIQNQKLAQGRDLLLPKLMKGEIRV